MKKGVEKTRQGARMGWDGMGRGSRVTQDDRSKTE